MASLLQDLRYSLRLLSKTPGFTIVAVLVLAVGIGVNSGIFTIANALLVRPMGYERVPGAVVGLYSRHRTLPDTYRGFSYANYAAIRDGSVVFNGVLAHTLALVGLTRGDTTQRVFADIVSANFFATLGAPLARGRAFTIEEERPGSRAPVAIVSNAYWRRTGADPDFVGKTIRVNGERLTVVGITRPGFTGTTTLMLADLYVPLGLYDVLINDVFREGAHTRLDDPENDALMLVARLQPGQSADAVAPQLDGLARALERENPAVNRDYTIMAKRLPRLGTSTGPSDDREIAAIFGVLAALASIVLIVACLNVANMMLARASARRKEVGLRLALGAGGGRIVRQLLVEGVLLSLAGGAAGLVLAYWAVGLVLGSVATALPIPLDVDLSPDWRVLVATIGFSLLSAVLFGLWPARRLSRLDVVSELKEIPGGAPAGAARHLTMRNALVAGQIALSLALLTAGGLFLRGALKAASADPGFQFEQGLVVSVDPALAGYDQTRGQQIYRALLDRLRGLPGFSAVSFASIVPFGEITESDRVIRPGQTPPADRRARLLAIRTIIGADYFAALGLPVLRGRDFSRAEEQSAAGAPIAIINEPLAARLFPGADPLGQLVQVVTGEGQAAGPPLEIVGVVPGLRHSLFDREPVPHLYVPFGQRYRSGMVLHLRLRERGPAAEGAALRAVREELRAIDDRLPVLSMKTLEEYRETGFFLWIVRTGARLFTTFGVLALLLAVVGLYGVKAYLVSLRTREIGIRLAIGASPRDVMWMVLREGVALTAVGLAIGLALAALVARVVASYLYQVGPMDPIVFTAAPLALGVAALAATWIPARRAMRVQPLLALRAQ